MTVPSGIIPQRPKGRSVEAYIRKPFWDCKADSDSTLALCVTADSIAGRVMKDLESARPLFFENLAT
jgi:hypothetical protein